MSTVRNEQQEYEIGYWCFKIDSKELIHADGHKIKLEDKITQLLRVFCENRGAVVSKEHIIETVWEGRELSEQTIPVAISKLRKALGDDINHPQMLETVPRQGYRLLQGSSASVQKAAGWDIPKTFAKVAIFVSVIFVLVHFLLPADQPLEHAQVVAAEKPGIIVTINDVRTTEGTKDRIQEAIAISELSSFFLAQVPEFLVIRHWWNLDAPDPTGGIFTRYGPQTPVYSLKPTLINDAGKETVTFILSDPLTDEVIWSGIHLVENGSSGLFTMFRDMLLKMRVSQDAFVDAPHDNSYYWSARYYMQLATKRAAKTALSNILKIEEQTLSPYVQQMAKALDARWHDTIETLENYDELEKILVNDDAGKPIGIDTLTFLTDKAAVNLYVDRNPAEAHDLLQHVLKHAPGDHYALSLFAEAKLMLGETTEAVKAIEKAIRLAPYARAYKARLKAIQDNLPSGNSG